MKDQEKNRMTTIGVAVVLAVIVGSLSAIVTSVATNQSINSYIQFLSEDSEFFSLSQVKPRPLPGTYEESLDRVLEVASPATATLRATSVDGLDILSWLREGNTNGSGAVVTSDGWILFHESALTGFIDPLLEAEVWVRGERFAIQEIVEDALSSAIMVRVDSRDLPSVAFGSTQDMQGGEILFAVEGREIVTPTSLSNTHMYLADLSLPAEVFLTTWELDVNPDVSSVLYNSAAELVAVYGDGETIPMHHSISFVQSTLRNQSAVRAAIGIYTVDIGSVININSTLIHDAEFGALIMAPDIRTSAVLRNSPAENADLKEGDVIISIQGQLVGKGVSLAELLSTQQVDSSVQVKYIRNGEVEETSLILASFADMQY